MAKQRDEVKAMVLDSRIAFLEEDIRVGAKHLAAALTLLATDGRDPGGLVERAGQLDRMMERLSGLRERRSELG